MKTRKFNELRDELYDRSPDAEERVATKVSELTDQLGLAELRARRAHTQAELAAAIGTTQSAVSRLEKQGDVLISTLRDYIAATGGRIRVIAEYDDGDMEIRLPVANPLPRVVEREFDVVWQNQETKALRCVGFLSVATDSFEFSYTLDAELDGDFQPFPAFPDLGKTYKSDELFPFFADRVVSAAKPGFDDIGVALGLDATQATPLELLSRSWGYSLYDTIQIVPRPIITGPGVATRFFLASGVRHVDEADPIVVLERLRGLTRGQALVLSDEPHNEVNPRAILLTTSGQPVGWVPDYLLDEVHKYRDQMTVFVEHTNGPPVHTHLWLLCRIDHRLDD